MRGIRTTVNSPRAAHREDALGPAGQRLAADGYLMRPGLLTERETRLLDRLLAPASAGAGQRELLCRAWAAALAARVRERLVATGLLNADARAVQCTLFDKTAARNWLVGWHQDLSVPVQGHSMDGAWRGWSVKHGVRFVQPPAAWLARLLAVRLHIDRCGAAHGPLRVLPGSHRRGKLALEGPGGGEVLRALHDQHGGVRCTAEVGDAQLIRPLTVHASSRMAEGAAQRRRVLHLVFAPPHLPAGLRWHWSA